MGKRLTPEEMLDAQLRRLERCRHAGKAAAREALDLIPGDGPLAVAQALHRELHTWESGFTSSKAGTRDLCRIVTAAWVLLIGVED